MDPGNTVNLGANGGGNGVGAPPVRKLPPLPILALLVGGGLGGIVFLYRNFRQSQTQTSQGSPQQVQASVPVMLGSLQQSLLDLQGQVGSGIAGLTSAVTTDQAATQAGITNAAAGLAGNLTTVQGNLTDLINAQGASYSDLLQHRADALQHTLDTLGSQVTQIGAGNDALSTALHDAFAALQGDLSSVQTDIRTVQQNTNGLQGQITSVAGQVSAVGGQLTGVGGQLSTVQQQQQAQHFQTLGNSYLGMATTTAQTSPLGSNDPRVLQWLQAAQNAFAIGNGQPAPYPGQPY